jgi:glutamine cyclotransferase
VASTHWVTTLRRSAVVAFVVVVVVSATACQVRPAAPPQFMGAPVCSHQVVRRYPHAIDAFTQGLAFHDGRLIESTGLEGRSSLRRVVLETGEVIQRVELADEYFAEGIAVVDDRVYQLTWTEEQGFIYDVATFEQVGEFRYEGEGWGLAHDGAQLVMSNGSAQLNFHVPESLLPSGTIDVTSGGEPVTRLNELEYVEGELWANVWQTDRIARIDAATGEVQSWLDLAGLLPAEDRTDTTGVLNGIAYDAAGDRLFVTGKRWPSLFEIRVAGC